MSVPSVMRGATAAVTSSVDIGDLSSGNVDQITARLDDPKTVQLVATATGMPQAEARKGADELASKVGARAEQAAAEAQPYAPATMWSTLVA